jgi:hypothetical protein
MFLPCPLPPNNTLPSPPWLYPAHYSPDQQKPLVWPLVTNLPQPGHWIGIKGRIDTQNRDGFHHRLCDQQPVERGTVMKRQRRQHRRMSGLDRQNMEIIGRDLSFNKNVVGLRKLILTKTDFDHNFSICRRTHLNIVRRIDDHIAGWRTQLGVLQEEPQKRMGVEQYPYSI